MTASLLPVQNFLSMTSREISDLTGKQHSHVMRDVRSMVDRLSAADPKLDWRCDVEQYLDEQGKPREMYRLDKDTTLCLVAGYDVEARMRIIKRWQELEAAQQPRQPEQFFPMAPLPTSLTMQCAAAELQAYALIGDLLAVPKHVTFQEGLKYIDKTYAVDLFPMFSASAHNDNILEHDVMLEPTELGKRFGLSAVEMNRWLAEHDLQVKTSTGWMPTDRGALISSRHSWSNRSKSGYNLKWSLSAVQRSMDHLAECA